MEQLKALFYLQVLGQRDDRAFAFAHQPTATNYSPAAAGSWNPAGTSKVIRAGVGQYQVVFNGYGARLPAGVGGHVHVNAVGTGKAYCSVQTWGGSPDLTVTVGCYTPAGTPADAKFTVLLTPPAAHLAYAWGDSPTYSQYQAWSFVSSNPVGGAITITRYGTGNYQIWWTGVDAEIRGWGNLQVTAYGEGGAQCKVVGYGNESAAVQCFAANGVPMDTQYTVLLAS
jgi:hypothetical protein